MTGYSGYGHFPIATSVAKKATAVTLDVDAGAYARQRFDKGGGSALPDTRNGYF